MSELHKILKKHPAVEKLSTEMLYYETLNKKYTQEYPFELTNCSIGLEIEVERVTANNVLQYPVWTTHQDGSLREGGMEYVTSPISGERIAYAINQFYDNLVKGYRFSPRTSIHVHQNCLDMTLEQIANECLIYSVVEKLLFKFVGGDRDKNNFCVPWFDASAYYVIDKLINEEVPVLEGFRYLALNPDSLRKFGTLEFRHLGGTDDRKKILQWINLIFCMRKMAMSVGWKVLKYRVDRLNSNSMYTAFLNDVFGSHASLLDQTNLKRDMEIHVSKAKGSGGEQTDIMKKAREANHRTTWWYKVLSKDKKKVVMSYDLGIRPAPRPRAPRAIPARETLVREFREMRETQAQPDPDLAATWRVPPVLLGDTVVENRRIPTPPPPGLDFDNLYGDDD